MDCGATNGSGSRISFPVGRATLAALRRTIDCSWRPSSIAIEPASAGARPTVFKQIGPQARRELFQHHVAMTGGIGADRVLQYASHPKPAPAAIRHEAFEDQLRIDLVGVHDRHQGLPGPCVGTMRRDGMRHRHLDLPLFVAPRSDRGSRAQRERPRSGRSRSPWAVPAD